MNEEVLSQAARDNPMERVVSVRCIDLELQYAFNVEPVQSEHLPECWVHSSLRILAGGLLCFVLTGMRVASFPVVASSHKYVRQQGQV